MNAEELLEYAQRFADSLGFQLDDSFRHAFFDALRSSGTFFELNTATIEAFDSTERLMSGAAGG